VANAINKINTNTSQCKKSTSSCSKPSSKSN